LAERVEERLDGLAIAPGRGPDQAPGVVVDDDRQVAVALSVADLVDPDPREAVEQIDLKLGLDDHPLADPADRAPRDPHQQGDRGLARVDRQPRRLILKRAREPCSNSAIAPRI
jgi:hypothetical protein